jgi:predicted Zn-dependent protease
MKLLRIVSFLCIAALSLAVEISQAADEDSFLGVINPPSEQSIGQGQSAIWTLPQVATEYQPLQPTPMMQAALQAQREGRFLEALIILENADKSRQASEDNKVEISLLHASFLLQGNQPKQAIAELVPLLADKQHSANAYALTAMGYLELEKMQEALEAANRAQGISGGNLPPLVLSYALQGMSRLAEAREVIHNINTQANTRTPQFAILLAREAELALTLDQIQSAKALVKQARDVEANHPYVIAVSGLVYLIDGQADMAKAAFEIALHRDPNDAKALLGLGLAEIKLGNFQAGQKHLQAAHEADSDNALILTYLGRSQKQAGQIEAAMASWRSAQQADPKDPTPWLYQAQAELQDNRPLAARESLRQAQMRTAYRSVYRGEHLLKEDEQLLQANLAEIQRRLGLDTLAFQTLATPVGEKNSANLRNQADVLQGQHFGESARRSLLLQSLFNDRPGNLPAEQDVYGDGAGQTGALAPQHGTVSMLNEQQVSYNSYDKLFGQRTTLAVDATAGNQNTSDGQVRAGVGSDTLGVSIALRQYKTDGIWQPPNILEVPNSLDNRIGQGTVQWRPSSSTQLFVAYQTYHSLHDETTYPWDPINLGTYHQIEDNSSIARLGMRLSLSDHSEVRGLLSQQKTDQTDNNEYISYMLPYSDIPGLGPLQSFPETIRTSTSSAHSEELQYRSSGTGSATQWGVYQYRGPYIYGHIVYDSFGASAPGLDITSTTRQIYVSRQQALNAQWQLDAQLAWQQLDIHFNSGTDYGYSRNRWLPKMGMVYTPNEATHVRLAAWKDMVGDTVGDATLEQATLAGIVMKRPGERNNIVQAVALGADRQLNSAWLLDGQAQRRFSDLQATQGISFRKNTDQAILSLHWQPGSHPFTAKLAGEYERVQAPSASQNPAWDSVQDQTLRAQQLGLRWLAGTQWTVVLDWSHNQVSASMQSTDLSYSPIVIPYEETFNQTDASVSWQFNKTGSMEIGVRNAENYHFQYTSIDPLNPRYSNGRLEYARLKLMW